MVTAVLLFGVGAIVLAVLWYLQYGKLRKEINKIPGPPTVPVFGNALMLKTDRKGKLILHNNNNNNNFIDFKSKR